MGENLLLMHHRHNCQTYKYKASKRKNVSENNICKPQIGKYFVHNTQKCKSWKTMINYTTLNYRLDLQWYHKTQKDTIKK